MQPVKRSPNRVEKVNSLIQHLLGVIILPYLKSFQGIITITKVQTSKDLRWAKIWISVVGGDEQAALNTFKNNIYDIQGELNRQMEVKMVPRLSFHLDTSGQYVQHINEVFKNIEDERRSEQ